MAKYFKKSGAENSIRTVKDDGKAVIYGCMGTVGDLKAAGILEMCDAPDETWCFLASARKSGSPGEYDCFADTKDFIKQHITNTFERA